MRPIFDGLKARCIGPANMGGRVVDLAVVESNPDTFYVATAGGGVWKTTDGGTTFTPVFDDQPTQCIGAVAVCQGKPDVVYVGTGEGNPRNSVSWGNGVYKSTDGGKTWKHCGLADTHHIGRVVVHPTNPDIAYVAALGHFWGPNKERGLYKTTDGGKTWEKSKFIDENTGFVDVQMDPRGSGHALRRRVAGPPRRASPAAARGRRSGRDGGLFKTTDGGKTWEKMAGGLPEKAGYGRCGLTIYRKDPNVVFAIVHTSETVGAEQQRRAARDARRQGRQAVGQVGAVETGGIFRSDDKGQTWKKINDLVPRPFYYGQIRVDPTDDKNIYVLGVAFHVSTDGGVTFPPFRTHDARRPPRAVDQPEGLGPPHRRQRRRAVRLEGSRARRSSAKRGLVISQFYGVAVDTKTPYRVYGGLAGQRQLGRAGRDARTRTASRSPTGGGCSAATASRPRSTRPTRTRSTSRASTAM